MALIIPYTFVAGTKAKAAEVNADFQAVATEVNSQGNIITSVQATVTNLQNNKAEVNGNSSNRFSVATPVNSYDAVNKIYLTDLTKYLLVGLQLKKDDDDYIGCSKGATFDTTYSKILQFQYDVSKQNANQGPNTTYYVYIEGSADGSTTDLLISLSSSNPALDSGFSLYQYLGYYTTDSDGNIEVVHSAAPSSGTNALSNVIPVIYINGSSGYRLWSDNYIEQWGAKSGSFNNAEFTYLKKFKDKNYNLSYTLVNNTNNDLWVSNILVHSYDEEGFEASNNGGTYAFWKATGYIE